MTDFDYDLFIIGAGSGGVRAGRIAAENGARVAVAEDHRVGGTCVIRGCVPKKLLVYAAHFSEDFETAAGFGWTVGESHFDWATLIANKDREIERLQALYIKNLERAGVRIYDGRARLLDRNTVDVAGETVTAGTILVATGGWPVLPDVPGIEHAITSNEALQLDHLPDWVAIVGGGYIAVEFAGIFNGMGAHVTQIYRGGPILRGFDMDLRTHLQTELTGKGIDVRTGVNVTAIDKKGRGLELALDDGTSLTVDAVMYATGRKPNTGDLGLEAAGVALAPNGAVKVDAYSRSSVENIYAVGDVTDRIALTPVAIKEGHAFALTCFAGHNVSPDHDTVASAVFSQPPVATVGLSEEMAREKYNALDIYESDFRPMKQTLGGGPDRAYTKLIVDRETDRVVGAHMIGADAPEIIQGIAIAVKAGLTKLDFDTTVAIHPSSAEEFVLMSRRRDN